MIIKIKKSPLHTSLSMELGGPGCINRVCSLIACLKPGRYHPYIRLLINPWRGHVDACRISKRWYEKRTKTWEKGVISTRGCTKYDMMNNTAGKNVLYSWVPNNRLPPIVSLEFFAIPPFIPTPIFIKFENFMNEIAFLLPEFTYACKQIEIAQQNVRRSQKKRFKKDVDLTA